MHLLVTNSYIVEDVLSGETNFAKTILQMVPIFTLDYASFAEHPGSFLYCTNVKMCTFMKVYFKKASELNTHLSYKRGVAGLNNMTPR